MPTVSAALVEPPTAERPAPAADSGCDPLAETLRPSPEDLNETRRLSRRGAKAEARPADPPGLRLRSRIGRGAFGSVWLADDRATGKKVAVKLFRHVRALDWPLLTREVEKLAALDASRHVVRLLAVGWEADPPYYVMEYLPDGSLADRLAKAGPPPVKEAVGLIEGVAAGLVHAHGSGILHCDLKPGNVLLDRDGAPRLCDFGQSRGPGRVAAPGESGDATGPAPLGTLFYMPPEQTLPAAAPDARWDVYALGAVLYELLTGSPPHRTAEFADRVRALPTTADRLAAYRRHVGGAERPEAHRYVRGVDRALARIVDRCLAVDPAARFPNAQAVRTALRDRAAAAARQSRLKWGLLGPAVLAAALIPAGATLAGRAVDAARTQVVARALDANALSARVVARSLEREVRRKRDGLERLAATDSVRAAVAAAAAAGWAGPAADELEQQLDGRTKVTAADDAAADAAGDTSWFLQDADGVNRWRKPFDPDVVDHNFVWRDYFHGRSADLPRHTPPGAVPPIRATHVSLPYFSTSTSEWKLAVSAPVLGDDGAVIAVLARTVVLDALLAEYDRFKRGIVGEAAEPSGGPAAAAEPAYARVIALYERRTGRLLDHPWLTARPDATLGDRTAARLRDPELAAVRGGEAGFRTPDHRDPVAELEGGGAFAGAWLAAFAPVEGTDWVAVVQEPRGAALRPVESLREVLFQTGLAITVGVAAALLGVYAWLSRERPAS